MIWVIHMYRKHQQQKKKIIIFTSIISIIILFIVLNFALPNSFKNIGKVSKDGFLYITRVVSKPFVSIKNYIVKSKDNVSYYNEVNEKLSDYQMTKDENEELKKELESLKEELDIKTTLSSKKTISTSVTNRNLEYWYDSFTISSGSNDGVENNMAVLYKGYLVGKVTDVGYNNSTVRLLTNSSVNNKISVKIVIDDKNVYGLLVGYKNGKYQVEGISDMSDIPIGSSVMTTGLGDFPSGLTLGTVSNVTTDNFDLAKILEVEPSINMDNIDYVLLVGKE